MNLRYGIGMRLPRFLQHRQLINGVAILAVTQFGASLAGLLRENVLARVFAGNLNVVDAYIAAFNPSDLIFQTCVVSAMGTVLVPILANYKAKGDDKEVQKVLSGTIGMTAILFGIVALLMAVFFPLLTPLFNIHFTGDTLQLYIQLGRLALLSNFLFVFGNAYGQYLVTVERYWIYGITPILYSLGTVFGTLYLTRYVGPFAPMYGTLLGAIIYVILRMLAVHLHGCKIRFSLWHPDLPQMARLMLPRVLSLGALQLQLLYLNGFASGLWTGAVVVNNYSRNFQSVLVGVVGISVAQAVYSRMSQAVVKRDAKRLRYYFRSGIFTTLLLTMLGGVAMYFLSPFEARLVHLSPYLHTFSILLGIYAISIPFESVTHIQYRVLYAMKNTFFAAFMGVLGGVVAIIVGWIFLGRFGIYALAIGYTTGEIVQATGLAILLPSMMRKMMTSKPETIAVLDSMELKT
jgi:putative peptidoglycan lipid II flippase